jgi:peptidoglycan/xylan/chitin deacetylase (PgdA/CDA1 family)
MDGCPETGLVCISADFELAWGWRFARGTDITALAMQERENIPNILKKLEELNLPITWAIVGHLFLDGCAKIDGRAHGDMPRPGYFQNEFWNFQHGDWYDHDPCNHHGISPDWYAPDLVKQILACRVKHEIACHSFSHIGFGERYCPEELADAELRKCAEVMAAYKIKPVSMVYPGNDPGHFSLLARIGYRCIRYFPRPRIEISLPSRMKEGLWAIPESSEIVPDERWDSNYLLWRLKKYVDKAINKKSLCHFWFHPSIPRERLNTLLFPLLEYCTEKRRVRQLKIMTMAGIGQYMDHYLKNAPAASDNCPVTKTQCISRN